MAFRHWWLGLVGPLFAACFGIPTLMLLDALGVPQNGATGGVVGLTVGVFWLIVGWVFAGALDAR